MLDNTATPTFIETIFTNIANFLKATGSYLILLIGIGLIIIAVVQIVKGFVTVIKGGWFIILGTLLFGGILAFSGWNIITSDLFGGIGLDTIQAISGDLTPEAVASIDDHITGNTALDGARRSIQVLSDSFFVPFAQALSVGVGIVLVVFGVAQLALFLIKSGKAQVSFVKIVIMSVIGSTLFTATPTDNSAGWTWIRDQFVAGAKEGFENAVNGNSTEIAVGLDENGNVFHQSLPVGADPNDIDT